MFCFGEPRNCKHFMNALAKVRACQRAPSVLFDDLGRRHRCVAIATDLSGAELQLALLYYAILFFTILFYRCWGAINHPIDHPIDHLNDLNPFFSRNFISPSTDKSLLLKGFFNFHPTINRAESVAAKALIQPFIFFIFQTRFETVLKQKRIKIDSKPNQKSNIFCSFQIKNRPKNHTVAIRIYGLSAGAITP